MTDGPLADPVKQKRAKDRAELRRAEAERDLRDVMATQAGRRFVWRLVNDVAGVCNGTFTGEQLSMAYAEGRRSIGRELMNEAQRVAPEAWVKALTDQLSEPSE